MEEECLLKERLQAIMDKKRIREDISRKRRDIEEEKVKLQYIKKKSLREQWLMDGLQSEEEREAMKIQAQDEVQRTAHLQSNILRMEEEMFALEQQELQLSANEEAILKRLKLVERTTEDIIKELSAKSLSDVFWPSLCPKQGGDSMSNIFVEPSINSPLESKRATFAMEICVELDKQTGKTQVISTASVKPETIHEKGLKVYEDSHKSVFALPPGEATKVMTEMTPTDVDELLRQATHWSGGVLYHQPIHAAPFTGKSSPCPIQNKEIRTLNPSPSLSGSRLEVYAEIGSTINIEANKHNISNYNTQVADDVNDSSYCMFGSTSSPFHNCELNLDFAQTNSRFLHCIPNLDDLISEDISGPIQPPWIVENNECVQSKTPSPAISEHTPIKRDKMRQNTIDNQKSLLVSVRESSDGVTTPTQLFYKTIEISSPSPQGNGLDTDESHFGHNTPSLDRANRVLEELSPGAVTLVFMGYKNVDEDEDDPIQAELVMVGNSEEENSNGEDGFSVYHPTGCTSKTLQPQVGIAKVTDGRYFNDELEGGESLQLHKPTFKYRSIKNASKSEGCDGARQDKDL